MPACLVDLPQVLQMQRAVPVKHVELDLLHAAVLNRVRHVLQARQTRIRILRHLVQLVQTEPSRAAGRWSASCARQAVKILILMLRRLVWNASKVSIGTLGAPILLPPTRHR